MSSLIPHNEDIIPSWSQFLPPFILNNWVKVIVEKLTEDFEILDRFLIIKKWWASCVLWILCGFGGVNKRNDRVQNSKCRTVESCGEISENQIHITFIKTGVVVSGSCLFVVPCSYGFCYNQAICYFNQTCNYYS